MSEISENWTALSSEDWYTSENEDFPISEKGTQWSISEQDSDEMIIVKDSCDISIQTTDTQAAVSLQISLQLAIALVLNVTIGDSQRSKAITEEFVQLIQVQQINKQKIIIENCRNVTIITTDTDLSVNLQALLQILLALVVRIDAL